MNEVLVINFSNQMMEEINSNEDFEEAKNKKDVVENVLETKQNTINENKPSKETIKLDDDEGDLCRICRIPAEIESPLYFPCACSGSIKYVHQECLLQWLSHSNARQCEVCKHPFAFSPIYASNAPIRLSLKELIIGVALKVGQSAKFCIRLLLVLCAWFLFVPFMTYWMWRFTFVRTFAEAQKLFMSRCTLSLILLDCLQGLLLSACIVFVFLGATSIREYFHRIREFNANYNERRPHGNMRLPAVNGGVLVLNEPPPNVRANNFAHLENDHVNEEQRLAFEGGNLLQLNVENVAAQLEIQAAQLEARVEQILDAPNDVDFNEDVPFDVLVGMEGSVFNLFENVITVLASNAIFLGLVAFIPFILGRLVLSITSKIIMATNNASMLVASILIDISSNSQFNINMTDFETNDIMSQKSNNFDMKVERIIRNDTFYNMIVAPILKITAYIRHLTEAGNTFNKMTGEMVFVLKLSNGTTIAIGYASLFVALNFYMGLIAFIRYAHGEPLAIGYIHGAPMVAITPSIIQQIVCGIQFMGIIIKVVILMMIELALFPILCGWWLDICTMEIFSITILQRISFFWISPITSTIIHWFVGIVHMLQIGVFMSIICQNIRPEILFILKDPTNLNYNPIKDLVHNSLYKHAQRIFLSIVMYGGFIALLIYIPTQIAMFIAPLMFPLNNRVSDPFTENPTDMLLFHFCIPFVIEHFRPRAIIKRALKKWFSHVGWMLGLSEIFILEQGHTPRHENYQNWQQRRQLRERIAYLEVVQNPLLLPMDIIAHLNDNFENSTQFNNDTTLNNDNEHTANSEERWREQFKLVLRIGLLIITTWTILLVVNTTMIILPIAIGRTVFAYILQLPTIHIANFNDIYAFNIGCYILWAITTTTRYIKYYLQTHDLVLFLRQIFRWLTIGAKSLVLLFLWIVSIPILIGLIFELIALVPFRVSTSESLVLFLYHDWALGLVTLQIWTKLVMSGYPLPFTDDSWRLKFEQVCVDGYSHLQGWWIFKEILLPIFSGLIATLCIPYVITHALLSLFGYPWFDDYAIDRFVWLGCLLLFLFWYGINRLRRWCINLHNTILDDQYLIGQRLHNFIDRRSKVLKQPLLNTTIIFCEETASVALQDTRSSISETTSIDNDLKDALLEPTMIFINKPFPTLLNLNSKDEQNIGSTSKIEGVEGLETTSKSLEVEGETKLKSTLENLQVEDEKGLKDTLDNLQDEIEQSIISTVEALQVESEQGIGNNSITLEIEGKNGIDKTSKIIEVEAKAAETSHCAMKIGVGIVLDEPKEGYCLLHEENEPLRAIMRSSSVPKIDGKVNYKDE